MPQRGRRASRGSIQQDSLLSVTCVCLICSIDMEAENVNFYLKSIIPKDIYIDIYNKTKIKYNTKTKSPYMFDDNHLTRFGADQVIDIFIKRYKY